MFHRPKAENEQAQTDTKVADKAPLDKAVTRAPVEQYVQQQMNMPETQAQNFQSLKDKIFDSNKKDTTATEEKKMSDTEDNNTTNRAPEMPAQASAFQKPGAGPRVPGAYPGAFPGSSNSVYGSSVATPGSTSATAAVADDSQRKLVVGPGITMSGEIECCDTLFVEGTVEAALKGASVLHVAESGVFYGTVEIDEATIAGRFEGDLKVNGRLTVKSTGSITGSIVYKELAIDAGATLDGKVSPIDGSKPATRKDGKKFSSKGSIANDGSELPFTGNGTNA
jgi:cytoskeletal protein CcmA (bactofilin family)